MINFMINSITQKFTFCLFSACPDDFISCSDFPGDLTNASLYCIPPSYLCDGKADCSNRGDELGCRMYPVLMR